MTTTLAPTAARPTGSRLGWAVRDTVSMAGRNLRKVMRAPDQIVFTLVSPIMFTLLFRYVFGGAIPIPGVPYVDYLIPGIAVQTASFASGNTGFALAEDRGKGFIDRLRSLPMARSAVLAGRVLADICSNAVGLVIIVIVGLAVGFRPHSVVGLVLALLLLLVFSLALGFVFALVGLYATNTQSVNAATFPVIFPLTFASSAFVPTATLPGWLRAFADHQPVSIVINAMRSLILGDRVTPELRDRLFNGVGTTALVLESLAWAAAIAAVFGTLSVRRYNNSAT